MAECHRDERIVGITAAMNSGTGLNLLQEALPERYFDVGIAEQNAILFASGLSLQGVKPVAAIYSTFLQRAFDQVVHDVCLQRLNVVFAMDRAGLVGDDGPTHHGAFDIAYLRCLPNIVLMAPRDESMLVHMLRTAVSYDDGPIALRYPRGEGVGVPLPDDPRTIEIGTGEILRQGERVAIIGYGTGVQKGLAAAELLAGRGMNVTVADARFAKPIDAGLMAQLAAEHDLLATVEEGVLMGGFGSAVWETLSETGGVTPRILRVGLPDRYVTHGKPALLHEEVGYTAGAHRRAHRGRGGRAEVGAGRHLSAPERRPTALRPHSGAELHGRGIDRAGRRATCYSCGPTAARACAFVSYTSTRITLRSRIAMTWTNENSTSIPVCRATPPNRYGTTSRSPASMYSSGSSHMLPSRKAFICSAVNRRTPSHPWAVRVSGNTPAGSNTTSGSQCSSRIGRKSLTSPLRYASLSTAYERRASSICCWDTTAPLWGVAPQPPDLAAAAPK